MAQVLEVPPISPADKNVSAVSPEYPSSSSKEITESCVQRFF